MLPASNDTVAGPFDSSAPSTAENVGQVAVVFRANITAVGSKPPGYAQRPLDSLFPRKLMPCTQIQIHPFAHQIRDGPATGSRELAKRLHLLFGQLNLHPHHDGVSPSPKC